MAEEHIIPHHLILVPAVEYRAMVSEGPHGFLPPVAYRSIAPAPEKVWRSHTAAERMEIERLSIYDLRTTTELGLILYWDRKVDFHGMSQLSNLYGVAREKSWQMIQDLLAGKFDPPAVIRYMGEVHFLDEHKKTYKVLEQIK